MFDDVSDSLDQHRLREELAGMSDDELAALEDDLDFCNFTGVASARVLSVLNGVIELDEGWQKMLERNAAPDLPAAYY